MIRSRGEIRASVAAERERAYAEWRHWSDATANRLLTLPSDERIRQLREHQNDLTEPAWYKVAQSLAKRDEQASQAAESERPAELEPAKANGKSRSAPHAAYDQRYTSAGDAGDVNGRVNWSHGSPTGTGHDADYSGAVPPVVELPNASASGHAPRSQAWWHAGSGRASVAASAPSPPPRPQPEPAKRSRGLAGHLYDLLVGLITIGGVVAGLVWLLSGKIN